MQENKLSVFNEYQEKLIGIEAIPSIQRVNYPTVVLAHGFGVTKEESGMFTGLSKRLCEAGFLVYRFDFSGCGESDGDYNETSLSKLKSDLNIILNFVKSRPIVDKDRIGILAQSFGVATTIALAPTAKTFVLLGSIANPQKIMTQLFGKGYNPYDVSVRIHTSGIETKVGPQYWLDFQNHQLLESIKKISSPILFIHGEKDEKVPISEMEAYFNNANDPKEKVIIAGADHGLKPYRSKMYEIATEWFTKNLI